MVSINSELINNIISLRLSGKKIDDIVFETKISKGTVSKYLNHYDIGAKVNLFYKFTETEDYVTIIRFLFWKQNPNHPLAIKVKNETLEKAYRAFCEKDKRYKYLNEDTKIILQKRYEELGNIKKLSKETHISYETLKKFIVFKKKSQNSRYDYIKKRRNIIKDKLIKYKGGECCLCHYNKCAEALELHHLNPSEKDFTIAKNYCKSWETIKKEADKCILVCSNCHKEIHNGYVDISYLRDVSPLPDKQ